jgi:formate hydrogenlyase subunit 3/multisubunit Na+/H+ antiporter MnhD subunit
MAWGVLLAFLAPGPAGAALSAVAVLAAIGQPLGVFPCHQAFVDRFAARPSVPRWSATVGLRVSGVLAAAHISAINPDQTAWQVLLVVLAGWTLGTAAVSTLDQPRWRRVLAAWMQAHSGCLLLAVAAGMGPGSGEGGLSLTTSLNLVFHSTLAHVLAVVLLIAVAPASPRGGFPEFRDDFAGWYLGQPIAAVGVILAGASLAGLPGTIGGEALRQIWETCLALRPIAGDDVAERSSLLLAGAIVSGLTVPVFLVPVADLARRLFWEIPPVSHEPSSRFVNACRILTILLVLAGGWLPKELLIRESTGTGGGNAAGVSKPIPLDRDDIALPPPRRPLARLVISRMW